MHLETFPYMVSTFLMITITIYGMCSLRDAGGLYVVAKLQGARQIIPVCMSVVQCLIDRVGESFPKSQYSG